jgi:hypothetical protein
MVKKTEEKTPKKSAEVVRVEPLNLQKIRVKVGGDALLVDRFPPDVAEAIMKKQTGESKSGKKATRDIKKEIEDAKHRLPDGTVGFPAGAFKSGMIEATSFVGDKYFSKRLIKGVVITNAENGLLPIKAKKETVLQHQIGHNTKFSPQLHNWTAEIELEYDANNVGKQDLIRLLNYAGHYFGVGIWSPRAKCGGNFGRYKVL